MSGYRCSLGAFWMIRAPVKLNGLREESRRAHSVRIRHARPSSTVLNAVDRTVFHRYVSVLSIPTVAARARVPTRRGVDPRKLRVDKWPKKTHQTVETLYLADFVTMTRLQQSGEPRRL